MKTKQYSGLKANLKESGSIERLIANFNQEIQVIVALAWRQQSDENKNLDAKTFLEKELSKARENLKMLQDMQRVCE